MYFGASPYPKLERGMGRMKSRSKEARNADAIERSLKKGHDLSYTEPGKKTNVGDPGRKR